MLVKSALEQQIRGKYANFTGFITFLDTKKGLDDSFAIGMSHQDLEFIGLLMCYISTFYI